MVRLDFLKRSWGEHIFFLVLLAVEVGLLGHAAVRLVVWSTLSVVGVIYLRDSEYVRW